MQIQCQKCKEWTNSETGSCAKCGEPIPLTAPSANPSEDNERIDINQLYSTGQRDKAESIINTQQDRVVIFNGMPTTGREILQRRKRVKYIFYVISIIIILIALAVFWIIYNAEMPSYYPNSSTDSQYNAPR